MKVIMSRWGIVSVFRIFRDICPLCTILNFTAIPDQLFVVEIFFSVFIFLALSNSLSKKYCAEFQANCASLIDRVVYSGEIRK